MRYDPDCVSYLIRTPMRGRAQNPPHIKVCLCDTRWPRALAFTLFWTRTRDTLANHIGDRWIKSPPDSDERALYFLEGWDVSLVRLPPTREAQKTDILQLHMREPNWTKPLVFTIYHGLGTRDTLWEFTEGGWKDE